MTVTLLREAIANPALWKLGSLRAGRAVSTADLVYNGQTKQVFQLTPAAELGSTWVAFEPSVYGGTGGEPRKGICFSVPARVQEDLTLLEDAAREALRLINPNVDSIWRSSIKFLGRGPAVLRAKIWTRGERACKVVNSDGREVQTQQEWTGLPCVPVFSVQMYFNEKAAGLILEVIGLMAGERGQCTRRREYQFL